MRYRLSQRAERIAFAASLSIMLLLPGEVYAGSHVWQVMYEATNLTDAASPMPVGPSVLLNVTNVGPVLGVSVFPGSSGIKLRGSDGTEWVWEAGSSSLTANGRVLPMSAPPLQQGVSLFLPADTVAELGGLQVDKDSEARLLIFRNASRAPVPPSEESLGDGWSTFTIRKPESEIEQNRPKPADATIRANPPPSRDRLSFGMGVGYVQDIDWGMEFTANGKVWGGDTNFRGLVTRDDGSSRLKSSYLSWFDRESGRGIEAGDLYSEAWGLVRGLRYEWRASDDRRPAVGVYLKTDRTNNRETMVSYQDDIAIGSNLRIRGEVGSDESAYGNAICRMGPLEIFAFQRNLPDGCGNSEGVFSSWSLSPSVSLFYGTHESTDSAGLDSSYRTLGLRVPLLERCTLLLEQTRHTNSLSSYTTKSAGLTVPLAQTVHLFLRYQDNSVDADALSGEFVNLPADSSALLTSLSLMASPRLHLDYQRSRYSQGGPAAYHEQLVTNYRLSQDTSLQMISGFPNILDSDLLRVRLNHKLDNDTSLLLDYGRLSPYQSKDDLFGKRGFMVMVRKVWALDVPARGGEVVGVVLDQLDQPMEDIAVKLGSYTAVTDKDGRYSFECVPSGTYRIAIPRESIPADYRADAVEYELQVRRDEARTINFSLTPLGSISGRVYIDRNGNGEYDFGEGVAEVAVRANDLATATNRDGIFSFYNLDPGSYKVGIAVEVLDQRYIVQGDSESTVELGPQESISNLEFALGIRRKPIIFTAVD